MSGGFAFTLVCATFDLRNVVLSLSMPLDPNLHSFQAMLRSVLAHWSLSTNFLMMISTIRR